MKKTLFIFFFVFILLASLIIAQPPFQESTGTIGLEIRFPQNDVLKANVDVHYHTHVYNKSSGLLVTNETTSCNIHIYNSTGDHTLEEMLVFDSNLIDFKLDIGGGNFSVGRYSFLTECNTSNIGGFVSGGFDVTKDGLALGDDKTAAISITIFILLLPLILFLLFLKEDLIEVKDKRKAWVNLLARRSCLTIAVYLMTLNAAIFASIARSGGLDILNEVFTYMELYGWVGYIMVIIIVLKTVMDLIENWKRQLKIDRGFDDEDDD